MRWREFGERLYVELSVKKSGLAGLHFAAKPPPPPQKRAPGLIFTHRSVIPRISSNFASSLSSQPTGYLPPQGLQKVSDNALRPGVLDF